MDQKQLKINYWYLISLTATMGLSSVTFGFSLASTGTAFEILKH